MSTNPAPTPLRQFSGTSVLEPAPDAPKVLEDLPGSREILQQAAELDHTTLPELLRRDSVQLSHLPPDSIPDVVAATYLPLSEDITDEKLREVLESFEKAETQEEAIDLVAGLEPELAMAVGDLLPPKQRLRAIFQNLYSKQGEDGQHKLTPQDESLFQKFEQQLDLAKKRARQLPKTDPNFHKDALVYALYVDLFNKNFQGLTDRLDYLKDLGVTVLWLLPILSSPMYDAGFDIDDYHSIRKDLGNLSDFRNFLDRAHQKGIRVIFDVAMNHTSFEHPWFIEAVKNPQSPRRDYYIWSDNTEKFKEARIIFKGLCKSNWEPKDNVYYFHRFFPHQPDLNYKNPNVLLAICKILIYWLLQGVDGFRADAIPYLWKEEGTTCENLPQTHSIVKFFRAILDYLRPGTILVAEACQPPLEVVAYFGSTGDECQVAYHFPLMPRIFLAISMHSCLPIVNTLNTSFTPAIMDHCQWFIFLRVHDELTLEMVTQEERELIHGYYCLQPEWDFREGEGVSARLAELLERNPARIMMAYSVMLTLLGTPIIFYGDEFGKLNDHDYYNEMFKKTSIADSRYYVRGRVDWDLVENELKNPKSFHYQVYDGFRKRVAVRKQHPCFSRGVLKFVYIADLSRKVNHSILAYLRMSGDDVVFVMHNLAGIPIEIIFKFKKFVERLEKNQSGQDVIHDLLGQEIVFNKTPKGDTTLLMQPFQHFWIHLNVSDL